MITVSLKEVYNRRSLSQVTDDYLIRILRILEHDLPEDLDVKYVEDPEDIVDKGRFKNYAMFKLEAETRGLVWRLT